MHYMDRIRVYVLLLVGIALTWVVCQSINTFIIGRAINGFTHGVVEIYYYDSKDQNARISLDSSDQSINHLSKLLSKRHRWMPSYDSFAPALRVSTATTRVDLGHYDVVILEQRETTKDVWRQYTCNKNSEFTSVANEIRDKAILHLPNELLNE